MKGWWNLHNNILSEMHTLERNQVEEATGKIPLLLNAFLSFGNKPFQKAWEDFHLSNVVRDIGENLTSFTERKKKEGEIVWNKYVL